MLIMLANDIIAATIVWASSKMQTELQFKIPLAVEAALPAFSGLLTLFISESPTWLLSQDQPQKALAVLQQLRSGTADIETEFHHMEKAMAQRTVSGRFLDIFTPGNVQRTLISTAYINFSTVSGGLLVKIFGTLILVQSGVTDAFRVTILIYCTAFIAQCLSPILADTLGRRKVVLYGITSLFALNTTAGTLAATSLKYPAGRQALAAMFIIFGFCTNLTFGTV